MVVLNYVLNKNYTFIYSAKRNRLIEGNKMHY